MGLVSKFRNTFNIFTNSKEYETAIVLLAHPTLEDLTVRGRTLQMEELLYQL
jgi:hypothetical protein